MQTEKRTDLLVSILVDLLEPGQDAWSDIRLAEANYGLQCEGEMRERMDRLCAALMAELEEIDPEQAARLRRADEAALGAFLARLGAHLRAKYHHHRH